MRPAPVLAALLLASCHAPAARTRTASIVVTSDLWGYLAPCGCSRDMRGGIDRAAAYVAGVRKEGPTLLIDAGDALFEWPQLSEAEKIQADKKARTLLASLEAMGLSAKAVTTRDQLIPEVLTALPAGHRLGGPDVREVGGLRVGLLPVEASSGDEVLASGAAALRKQKADFILALAHGPRARVLAMGEAAQAAGIDAVVGSGAETVDEGDKARAAVVGVPVLFTQARGQSLLRIDLTSRPGGGRAVYAAGEEGKERELAAMDERIRSLAERIAHLPPGSDAAPFQAKLEELRTRRRTLAEQAPAPPAQGSFFTARFVPLTEDLPGDPAVTKLVQDYDRAAAEANLAFARAHGGDCPKAAPGEPVFVGGTACASCHAAAMSFWKSTRHAAAYATLQRVGKQYDLSCIGCHVTGWEQAGGACRIDDVSGREDVTCESCHGAGSLHVAAPAKVHLARAVPERTCRLCHTRENSTAFDYATYLPQILGPGHGKR
jgi:hypothetical protein